MKTGLNIYINETGISEIPKKKNNNNAICFRKSYSKNYINDAGF